MKTIGIIVFDDVLTSEIIAPAEVFGLAREHDWFAETQVVLIGIDQHQPTIRTAEGITIGVNTSIEDDPVADILWIPGGKDMDYLLQHQALNLYIRKHEHSDWLASVCSGAYLLGRAGMLDGKQATTWFGGETDLQAQFPAIHVIHSQPVVLDNRRITANGGLVSYQSALVLLGKMVGAAYAKVIYESLSMDRLGCWRDIENMIGVHTTSDEG
jgi:transcriptional regulator GlxA family with amidase domain